MRRSTCFISKESLQTWSWKSKPSKNFMTIVGSKHATLLELDHETANTTPVRFYLQGETALRELTQAPL